jgi:transposase
VVTAGQGGDSPQFAAVLGAIRVPRLGPGRPRTRPERVLADKAYSSKANRALLRCRSIRATIPEKDDQAAHRRRRGRKGGRPPAFDAATYKLRHAVECGINRLNGTGRWPLGTTSWLCATGPPSASPPSTSGYDF